MSDVENVIEMLKSDDPRVRLDACETLSAMPTLPSEAIDALYPVTIDENQDVADAAQRALALHAQISNEPEKEPDKVSETLNLTCSLIVGSVACILFPLLFGIVVTLANNTSLSLGEFLFLDLPIFQVFFGEASSFGFLLTRALAGGVFGFLAYSILNKKKLSTTILRAFIAGLIGGGILLSCGVVFSVQ